MHWADYRKGSNKAKIHLGFDLNHAIPSKIFFTDGKGAERLFVQPIISIGQTVVADRGYQEHALFDALQLLGSKANKNQSQTPIRLVGYRVNCVDYWIATDRRDLTAEQIAEIYKLR